jgi:molecular chaperone IbpA
MRTFDLSPLFRTSVGFDHLNRLLESAQSFDSASSYPPYDIEAWDENTYCITMAVAGFSDDDIEVTVENNVLQISGHIAEPKDEKRRYLHRGIASRAFEHRFQLADHILVTGAKLENGLLHLELAREIPEELKPRHIAINTEKGQKTITANKAA